LKGLVTLNAPASITNVANVSGGGDSNLANNASSDVVVIADLDPIVIQPVPALHEWSLVLLAILLGLSGSAAARYSRRQTTCRRRL
jgi:IPTL-CTERM motif